MHPIYTIPLYFGTIRPFSNKKKQSWSPSALIFLSFLLLTCESYILKEEKEAPLEILYNKEICNLQLKKRRFIRLSSKFYYKSGQWLADFIIVVRVHKPSSCPTDYTFYFSYRFLGSSFTVSLSLTLDTSRPFLPHLAWDEGGAIRFLRWNFCCLKGLSFTVKLFLLTCFKMAWEKCCYIHAVFFIYMLLRSLCLTSLIPIRWVLNEQKSS